MTHEQFEQAAQYWNKKEKITMPEEALKQAVEKYIQENNTCALADHGPGRDHRTVFRQLQCPRGIQEDSTGGTEKIRASHEPDLRDTGQDRCAVF